MPVYEYKCQNGHRFESFHSYSEKVDKCIICGAQVEKIISSFSSPRMWNSKGYYVLDRARKSPDWEK